MVLNEIIKYVVDSKHLLLISLMSVDYVNNDEVCVCVCIRCSDYVHKNMFSEGAETGDYQVHFSICPNESVFIEGTRDTEIEAFWLYNNSESLCIIFLIVYFIYSI